MNHSCNREPRRAGKSKNARTFKFTLLVIVQPTCAHPPATWPRISILRIGRALDSRPFLGMCTLSTPCSSWASMASVSTSGEGVSTGQMRDDSDDGAFYALLGSCSLPLGSVNLRRKLRLTRSDLYFSKPHENFVMQ